MNQIWSNIESEDRENIESSRYKKVSNVRPSGGRRQFNFGIFGIMFDSIKD